jgi:hypothetical protein
MTTVPPAPLAVLIAVLSTFVLGGLWYSPLLFGKRWQALVGLTDEALGRDLLRVFGAAVLAASLFCVNLGFFIGGASSTAFGAFAGFATGFGFVAAGLFLSYTFARRPLALVAIDAGYHVVAGTAAGVIFGAFGG